MGSNRRGRRVCRMDRLPSPRCGVSDCARALLRRSRLTSCRSPPSRSASLGGWRWSSWSPSLTPCPCRPPGRRHRSLRDHQMVTGLHARHPRMVGDRCTRVGSDWLRRRARAGRHRVHVVEQERRPLPGHQALEGGDEGEADRLAGFEAEGRGGQNGGYRRWSALGVTEGVEAALGGDPIQQGTTRPPERRRPVRPQALRRARRRVSTPIGRAYEATRLSSP